jgi:hypothetical protein
VLSLLVCTVRVKIERVDRISQCEARNRARSIMEKRCWTQEL